MNIRHGDMLLRGIEKLPEGLVEGKSNILTTGSGGNHHTFINGTFCPKQADTFIFGYFVSGKGCELHHPDHGQKNPDGTFITKIVNDKEIKVTRIPEGLIFELRKQQEETHEEMRPVID